MLRTAPVRLLLPVFALISAGLVAACGSDSAPAGSSESAATAPELPVTLDTQLLLRELTARGVRSKSEALALLPRAFKQRFVLVTNTGAIGMASRARPRVVHFTEDAKLLIATSGHSIDEDITANSLEILEHDDATNAYRTHTLEIDPVTGPHLIENDARCVSCHGEAGKGRAIWGSYPSWPAAYGGTHSEESGADTMTPDELADFHAFHAQAKTDPDYRHLEIHETWRGFYLPTHYGYPNTIFGSALANRQAADLYTRMKASSLYSKLEYALVADNIRCDLSPAVTQYVDRLYNAQTWDPAFPAQRTTTKLYRLLGIDPIKDLHLTLTITSPPEGSWEPGSFYWNAGSDYLPALVAVQAFARIVANDAPFGELFASKRERIASLDRGFHATRTEILGYDEKSYRDFFGASIHWTILYPVMNAPRNSTPGEGKEAAVCSHLDAAQRARQLP